jgi:hypothetical protein
MHSGEVSAGVLQKDGKEYLVLVGEHPTGATSNGVTMLYDINEDVRCCCNAMSLNFSSVPCISHSF